MKLVPGGDNLVKGVQCYELFGGIALKITLRSHSLTTSARSRISSSSKKVQLQMSEDKRTALVAVM